MRTDRFSVAAFNYPVKMKELAHGVFRLRNPPQAIFRASSSGTFATDDYIRSGKLRPWSVDKDCGCACMQFYAQLSGPHRVMILATRAS
jgi:hypothetical protein